MRRQSVRRHLRHATRTRIFQGLRFGESVCSPWGHRQGQSSLCPLAENRPNRRRMHTTLSGTFFASRVGIWDMRNNSGTIIHGMVVYCCLTLWYTRCFVNVLRWHVNDLFAYSCTYSARIGKSRCRKVRLLDQSCGVPNLQIASLVLGCDLGVSLVRGEGDVELVLFA